MQTLLETQKLLIEEFESQPYFDRVHYENIRLGNRINGIVGPRGTGKTTFLLKTAINNGAKEGKALYVSADSLFFLENKLLDIVEWMFKETDITMLLIDEIQKYHNWNQELKNTYDVYRNIRVVFSGSSMIDIIRSKYDLSRRVTLYPMVGLSFREYAEYYCDIKLPRLSLEEIFHEHEKITSHISESQLLKYFNEYLQVGYYPHLKDLEYNFERFQSIENAVQKTIYEDIATFHNLRSPTLGLIEKLYKYIINSQSGEMSVTKLSNRLGKDFDSISNYLSFLEQSGLVHFLYPKKSGHAYLRNPVKVLPENTNMIFAMNLPGTSDAVRGKVRETFIINQLKNTHHEVYYSDKGDFKVITPKGEIALLEIGGKNKNQKQLADEKNSYIVADGILTGYKNTIPLFLFGMMY